MKIYVVLVRGMYVKSFDSRERAYQWAENQYGCKADGICVDGVEIRSATLDS